MRRAHRPLGALEREPEAPASADPRAVREAAGTLLARLSPQERAALVLKDVFDYSLEEIAETLVTTPGAIKAALHRGRERLRAEGEAAEARETGGATPARTPVLDAFCAAFNARDLAAVTALLTETAVVEVVRRDDPVRTRGGAPNRPAGHDVRLRADGDLRGDLPGDRAAVPAERPPGPVARRARPASQARIWSSPGMPTPERRRGRRRWRRPGGGAGREPARGSRKTAPRSPGWRTTSTNPEFIAEVCQELGVPYRINGYSHR